MPETDPTTLETDVAIVGGAFAASSFALLLRRWRPETRILLVERRSAFDAKIGEATVEVSACFLHRVLGLYDELSRDHLPKHGLRFWLADGPETSLEEMTEIGPSEVPRLPSFQLDRERLDELLLAKARAEGAEVLRPAKVVDFEPGRPTGRLVVETEEGPREVQARWVVDATGRQAFLAKRLGLHERVEEHPTAALWGRWEGVKDLDGPEIAGEDPRCPRIPPVAASRRLATNHFTGYGFWSWVIPLADGRTSIGLVYDKSRYKPPGEGSLRESYERFVTTTPGLRELVAEAEPVSGDFFSLRHLPYRSRQYMGPGWALLGDAAAFLDPFYSPGLDHAAMSIYATAKILDGELSGRFGEVDLERAIEEHNAAFALSYGRWLEALYLGKYEILGDAELVACAFLLDTALYYLGVVTPVYRDLDSMANPIFGGPLPQGTFGFLVLRFFNRRLQHLARFRRATGRYGRRNSGWRVHGKVPGLGNASLPMLRRGLALWLRLEAEYFWHAIREGGFSAPSPTAEGATR